MAFNPFHSFRKYRKQSFAILTIICMLTFVLSSGIGGGGDFFEQVAGLFGGGKRARGGGSDEVARLDGRKITEIDLQHLRRQRELANDFMANAVALSLQTVAENLERDVGKLGDSFVKQQFQQALQGKKLGFGMILTSLPQLRMAAQVLPMLGQAGDKDRDEVQRILAVMEQMALREASLAATRTGFYFDDPFHPTGDPRGDAALLDFMVLQVHADRLKLKFNEADVRAAVDRETLGGLTREKGADIEKMLRSKYPDFSSDRLMTAIGEELRVRTVRAAFLDAGPRQLTEALELREALQRFNQFAAFQQVPPAPSAAGYTPYDLWDYFRNARTEIYAVAMPLNVDAFLPQVTAQPTEDELRKLFAQYQKVEPAPNQDSPGFKQPRQVKVQFLSGRADLPFYRQGSTQAFAAANAASLIGAPAVSGGFPSTALKVGLPIGFNLRLIAEYSEWLKQQPQPWPGSGFTPPKLSYASVRQPGPAAAFIGHLLGTAGTNGALTLGPLVGWAQSAFARDIQVTGQRGSTAVLSALGAATSPLGTVAAVTLPRVLTPPQPTLEEVHARLAQQIADEQAKIFFIEDTEQVRKELERLGKEKKIDEFNKFLTESAQKRGLTVGASTQPGTMYTLIDDPGLKPLREQFQETRRVDDPLAAALGFAEFFFTGNPTADANAPQPAGSGNGGPVLLPRWFPGGTKPLVGTPLPVDRPIFLTWKTEDKDAHVRKFEDPGVREQVQAAWKLLKARGLAEQEARRLAEQAKALKGDLPTLRDFAAQHKLPLYELGPAAMLMPAPQTSAGVPRQYEPYHISRDLIAYPGDFVDRLLRLKDKPIGATDVLPDQPRQHFYIVSLTRKIDATEAEFDRSFFAAGRGTTEQDTLFQKYQQQQAEGFRSMVMEQLRLDAGLQVNTENLVRRRDREE